MNPKKLLQGMIPFVCIAPAFLLIVVFKVYPIFSTVLESLTYKNSLSLKNYVNLFEDPLFWNSCLVTFKFNIVTTPLQIILAVFMALLVNEKLKGIAIFRTIFYLPVTISMTIATILWALMLNPNNGIVNGFLALFHIAPQPFLISKDQALWSIMLMASWKGIGYWMMFLLAGLQNISKEVYEAARIDGANWWRTTLKITLPLLKNSMLFVVVADTTANLLLFAPMYMVTKGGPNSSTNVLMYEAYKSSFLFVDRGRATAVVTILLAVVALIVAMQFRLMGNDVSETKKGKRRPA